MNGTFSAKPKFLNKHASMVSPSVPRAEPGNARRFRFVALSRNSSSSHSQVVLQMQRTAVRLTSSGPHDRSCCILVELEVCLTALHPF